MLTTLREQLITGVAQTEKVLRMCDDPYKVEEFLETGRVLLGRLRASQKPIVPGHDDDLHKMLQEWHTEVFNFWADNRPKAT